MMRLRFLVPVLGLVGCSLLAAACTDSGDDTPGGDGGAGGEAPSSGGSTSGTSGNSSVGGEGGAGGDCATDGVGTLVIEVTGLPAGVAPDIDIDGPEALNATEDGPLEGVEAGSYTVKANRVFDEDPIVRTVFDATVTTPSLCLAGGGSQTIKVAYDAIPSSNKLWMPGADPELVGFSSADIAETVMTDATVSLNTPGVGSGVFDKDGNLWTAGTTIGEDMLMRFPAASLGDTGASVPDIRIKVPEIECFPFINHIAFDPSGNLWLSACEDQIHRINAADLKTSGDKESDVLFTEVIANSGIAFDKAGNLWVSGPTVLRFDAARLDSSDTDPADLEISVQHALSNMVLGADELAFDKAGNLWAVAGSTVYELAASDLEGKGNPTVKANVSFDVDLLALPSTPAFDESNALWVSLGAGTFGKYGPAKLAVSKAAGAGVEPDVLISSDSITSTLPLAFFPAPQGLPLYHSIPEE
jgi:hypothetical protein